MKYTQRLLALVLWGATALCDVAATPLPLHADDSIRMEKRHGQWFVLHAVEKGETLYALARRYGSTYQAIQAHNKDTQILSIGQQLYIPVTPPATFSPPPAAALKSLAADLSSSEAVTTNPPISRWPSDALFARPYAFRIQQEEGIAVAVVAVPGHYALHRHAPLGTFIRIKNLLNGKQIMVRVIGRLPAVDENKQLLVKLSTESYKQLGSPDARLRVALYYLQPTQ